MNHKFNISEKSALFLDRDGVINKKLENDYVKKPEEFIFIEGSLEAISILSKIFNKIIIVTNQQGIGKGLMTPDDLTDVHNKMLKTIQETGGRIDKIYYCPDLAEKRSFFRKPAIGMALKAKKDFPEISFKSSYMVGDMLSDMEFGKKVKMKTILISKENSLACKYPHLIDFWYTSLLSFANDLLK